MYYEITKKDYYNQMLQMHKNNIKATWGVLNDMIKKSGKKDFPTYFEKNDN